MLNRLSLRRQFLIFASVALAFIPGDVTGRSAANPSALRTADQAVPLQWQDTSGKTYRSATRGSGIDVLIFVSSHCPISSIYCPRIEDLAHSYQSRGARFFFVNSSPLDSIAVAKSYAKDHGITFPVVNDPQARLADAVTVSSTPEAVVLDPRGQVQYRGRIDDNRDREKVFRHDLQDAIEAVLAGRPVPHPRTIAFGCQIFHETTTHPQATTTAVTYTRDVAPILNQNCVPCHRPGESGPFSLQSYGEARVWSQAIRDYTTRRIMPPWKATAGYGSFRDERRLSDRDTNTLARWAEAGAPYGDHNLSVAMPQFAPAGAFKLGKPDLLLQSARPYHVPADGPDIYREFVLPAEFADDRYLGGVEFRPDNRAVVHHIILYLDPTRESTQLDGHDSEPGYTVPGVGVLPPESHPAERVQFASGWALGNSPYMLPKGIAFRIPAHAALVLQVHYHPDGKPEHDQSAVALHFVDRAHVDQVLQVGAVSVEGLDLKPGDSHQVVSKQMTLRDDVHVWSVSPHMHMLGRSMKLTATLPSGRVEPLIWVQDWDFNWQETYVYRKPVALPKGTRVNLETVYDNSDRNPRQTSHPPKEVHWGEQTTDEMCIGFYTFTIDQQHLGEGQTAERF